MLQGLLTRSSPTDWTSFSSWNTLDVFLKHILQLGFIWKKSSLHTPKALRDVSQGRVRGNEKEIHFQSTLVIRTRKCRCTSWKLETVKTILKTPANRDKVPWSSIINRTILRNVIIQQGVVLSLQGLFCLKCNFRGTEIVLENGLNLISIFDRKEEEVKV